MHVDDEFYHWGHYYDMLKTADCIFALTSFSKKQVYDKLGSICINIGAGVDQQIFLNDNVDGSRFREKYHLEGKKIILTVSRKSPIKHYEYIIRAIEEMHHDFNDIVMVMIGPDEDKIAIESKKVLYLGKIEEKDLVDAYDACDIFAMMSESESFGMVFCEAWSRKKPVIGNRNCGAVAALIDNNLDGFLCSGKKELIIAITKLLNDKDTAALFGERGYQKVINNYTWEIIADRVLNCYNTIA
jgi:glycosyltransferase involved in cell wall biosynthesis